MQGGVLVCVPSLKPQGGGGRDGLLHVRGIAKEFPDMQSGIARNRDALIASRDEGA